MSLPVRLVLMPFLQDWDATTLSFNLLLAPQTDPTQPPALGLTAYDTTDFNLEVRLVSDLSQLPLLGSAAAVTPVLAKAMPEAHAICVALDAQFGIDKTVGPIDGRVGAPRIMKYAPPAYRAVTGYGGQNPNLVTDDTYHCAIKSPVPPGTSLKPTPPVMSWGKVLAQVLRQPLLAEPLGLIRKFSVTPSASVRDDGGWLFVTLAPGFAWSPLLGTAGAVRHYAARIPPLGTAARPLFTPALFPVGAAVATGAGWDDVFREAIEYDDGFAKAVYARQPHQADPIADEAGERPPEERGVQLGWDDEQLITWFNRQVNSAPGAVDAPMGVLGYRVDVRRPAGAWASLVLVKSTITLGTNQTNSAFDWKVEVAPNRLMGDVAGRSWVPSYLIAWNGRSLIGMDETTCTLRGVPYTVPPVEGLRPTIALRYGEDYEFRVRFADLTGGGPVVGDSPRNGGPQPNAPITFLRHVRPVGVKLLTRLPLDPDPSAPPASIKVARPLLGFPTCLMAGGSEADLLADVPTAKLEQRAPGLPDPDVEMVEISVQVASPEPGAASDFVTLYTTTRAFPAAADLTIDLDWIDVADVADLPQPVNGPVALPTSREVRLELTPIATARPKYYAAEDVRRGQTSSVRVRKPAEDERELLAQGRGSLIEAFFLQPAEPMTPSLVTAQAAAGFGAQASEDPLGRLAAALDLDRHQTTLRAKRGERVLFGASAVLRHVIGPDSASLTFATANEMTRLWLVAVVLELKRDWTWDGLDHISIKRDGKEVGRIEPGTGAGQEAQGDDRNSSTLVFLDAIDPKPAPGALPRELDASYTVTPVFKSAPVQVDADLSESIRLPVTTPPAQVPKLVSAGLALSPYQRDPAYAATEERRKAVWLEFDRPCDDPEDRYYARVLAEAPDPVLTDDVADVAELLDLPLPVDPEPIRRVVPGQGDDRAGQSSMQMLVPTTSPVHFLLPLPPGIEPDSPALFGFFTYEFRIGHFGVWSTAQGFPGRAQRVAGIQHAPPALVCGVTRSTSRLVISAEFADAIRDGRSVRASPPVTELWALVYAQVHQADDGDRRNILLDSRKLELPPRQRPSVTKRVVVDAGAAGARAQWSSTELTSLLQQITLGPDAPLSCLVVETLPGEQPYADPLRRDLGYERFLRTSPLTAAPPIC